MKTLNREEYLQYFKDTSKHKKALEIAHATRKFEIELYWKRALYYWAFVAATFSGYFLILISDQKSTWINLIISFLGILFSISWHLVSRGSKYWQQNWEKHVDYLEDKITGPLYKLVIIPDGKKYIPIKYYTYSVSKINMLLSFLIVIIWTFLFEQSLQTIYNPSGYLDYIIIYLLSITITLFIILLFDSNCKTKTIDNTEQLFYRRDEK